MRSAVQRKQRDRLIAAMFDDRAQAVGIDHACRFARRAFATDVVGIRPRATIRSATPFSVRNTELPDATAGHRDRQAIAVRSTYKCRIPDRGRKCSAMPELSGRVLRQTDG